MKKLFALLISAGLLSLAVGCPPASSTSGSHSGPRPSAPGSAGSGGHMPPMMTSTESRTHAGGAGTEATHRGTTLPPETTKKEGSETKKETKTPGGETKETKKESK